MEQLFQVDS